MIKNAIIRISILTSDFHRQAFNHEQTNIYSRKYYCVEMNRRIFRWSRYKKKVITSSLFNDNYYSRAMNIPLYETLIN